MIRISLGFLLTSSIIVFNSSYAEQPNGIVIGIPNKFTVEAGISRGSSIRVVGVVSCVTGIILASRGITTLSEAHIHGPSNQGGTHPTRSKIIKGASLLGAGTLLSALGLLGILNSEPI